MKDFDSLARLLSRQIELLAELLKRTHRLRRWVIVIQPLEPITPKEKTMSPLDIGQVPLGQRRPVTFVPDEPVDVKPDGNYGSVVVDSGDSTVGIKPGSTPTSITAYFNGDGALGRKSATFAVDGHVGEGDVEITQEIDWEVVSPDATTFTASIGALEPIPGPSAGAQK